MATRRGPARPPEGEVVDVAAAVRERRARVVPRAVPEVVEAGVAAALGVEAAADRITPDS
jgi:hypothetical protein